MEPGSQASEAHTHTPFKKVEAGIEALFSGEKHSHIQVGHVCDHLHPEHLTNRYHSFAPETTGDAKWFVDGCSYFYAVSQALERQWNAPVTGISQAAKRILQVLSNPFTSSIGG